MDDPTKMSDKSYSHIRPMRQLLNDDMNKKKYYKQNMGAAKSYLFCFLQPKAEKGYRKPQ